MNHTNIIKNGLHSYPRNHPSLGILNELIGQDSNSPMIVVVDFNNQARTLDDELDPGHAQRQGRHVHKPDNHSVKFSERDYENALYELLRASEKMLEKQHARCGGKKDSCEDTKEILAEQCSESANSCDSDSEC